VGARPEAIAVAPAAPAAARGRFGRWTRATGLLVVAGLVGAVALSGCAGPEETGPTSARVSAWLSTAAGGAAIGAIEVDSRNIDLAFAHHQPAASIKTVCALLTNDAETAIGNLPTPDTRLTNELNAAYEDGAAAGDHCYQGASGNQALLRRSAAERRQLVPLMTVALARMNALVGHTTSTSTTAPAPDDDPFS
jgi:hypothetical protein